MNLYRNFNKNDRELLKVNGEEIEDREYSQEEIRKYELEIEEFIMNHSIKNGDISKLNNKYREILIKLVNYQ